MNLKSITAAFVAAALTSVISVSFASAQSYDGGPECGYGRSYDKLAERCVDNHVRTYHYGSWDHREYLLRRERS